ncbi:MAG: DUF6502 family protein [Pseudomonadota bacterium]
MFWIDPILKPLARLAIQKGLLFQQVEKRLKHAYVLGAKSMADAPVTDSKISIVTGLQRRDISKLRSADDTSLPQRQPLAEIIALWRNAPEFDVQGIPVHGEGASFASLARTVRQDVHPRTFLDILIDNEAVKEDGDKVILLVTSYQPKPGTDDQLAYLAGNVGDHFETAVANALGEAKNYDMGVHYTNLSAEAIEELKTHFRLRLNNLLIEMDEMAQSFPESGGANFRFRAGGYFYDDTNAKADTYAR